MQQLEAFARLKRLRLPIFSTGDAAGCLSVSHAHASKILARLRPAGVVRLKRGVWAIDSHIDPLELPEGLMKPAPTYLSLQTALYHHQMIEQIPSVIYAVSLGRPKVYRTELGTCSIHQVAPELFFGYELIGTGTVKMAIPEKALLDILYLSTSRTKLFASLPELEFPDGFRKKKLHAMAKEIPSRRKRTMVERKLKELLDR